MHRRALLGGAAASLALTGRPGPARAQKFVDLLRVSWSDAVTSLDPYASPLRTTLALMPELWDGLIYRDPDTLEVLPLLAVAWRQASDTALEFTLRPDVFFHDGAPLGPEDVIATVRRALGAGGPVGIPSNYAFLAGAEKFADMGVRLHLAHPFPTALDFIAAVLPIVPRDAAPDAGIGTGPWRVAAFSPERIALERHEAYWPGSPKGTTRIPSLEIDQPTDPVTPFNDLVSGRCDWIWQLTPHQYELLAQAPDLQALRAESMRVAYLALDAAGRGDPGGPLTVRPVRRAIAHAIDRARLSGLAVAGGSRLIDTPCYPTQYACDPVQATAYGYDPEQASVLLSKAGFPDGFHTTLVSYERAELVQAVVDDLGAVGIVAEPVLLRAPAAMARAAAGHAPLFFGTWGSSSINAMAAFLPPFFGGGPLDDAGIPGLPQMIADAVSTIPADRRRALYAEAIAQITGEAVWLPLYIDAATYGISRTVDFHPAPDELPRFFRVSWR